MNFDLLFEKAKAKGIEDLQVYMDADTGLSIMVFKGEIDEYKIFSQSKLSVKGIYDSKMGTVTTEIINGNENGPNLPAHRKMMTGSKTLI